MGNIPLSPLSTNGEIIAGERRGLALHGETRYASLPSKKVVVTWMARRSSVQASWDFEDSLVYIRYKIF